jgi:hypothetical protein
MIGHSKRRYPSGMRMRPEASVASEIVFLVSVDTEEDNWTPTRDGITTENVRQLPKLNAVLERLGARPTYFVAHSVATEERSSRVIADLAICESVEIGAHLHPWNTPPLLEPLVPRNTMLLNLPAELQRAKVERLTSALEQCMNGLRPISFRAGRWGFGTETIGALLDSGYLVDSSVTPFANWASFHGANHDGAPVNAYRLDKGADVRCGIEGGRLIEIPVSFGFNRSPLDFWRAVHQKLGSSAGRAMLLNRLAAATGLLHLVTLSPETDSVDDMIELTRALLTSGAHHLHLYFHSPSLTPGLTPFTRTANDVARFYAAIDEYLQRISAFVRPRFATVSEAAALLESTTTIAATIASR